MTNWMALQEIEELKFFRGNNSHHHLPQKQNTTN